MAHSEVRTAIDKSWYKKPKKANLRTSAGGVIVRASKKHIWVALAKGIRQPDYILPKGGVEKGETLEQAARREIKEEAGFRELYLLASLGSLERFTYDKRYWVTTHYFLFLTTEKHVQPTEEKRHTKPDWFKLNDLPKNFFWPEQQKLVTENVQLIQSMVSREAN